MKTGRLARILLTAMVLGALVIGAFAFQASAAEPFYHTVKYGQTLGWVAWRYGVSIQALKEANEITNANLIYAGKKLVIPGMDTSEYVEYTVKAGDSLLTIAAKYGVKVWDIARVNGLWNTNLVFEGDKLLIPGGGETPPAPRTTPPDQQEAIIISSPVQSADVKSPVTVKGWGSGFENNLAVQVLDQDGKPIGQGYAMVDAEFGQIGPFTGAITFAVKSAQPGRISVYSVSPRDGAIEHLASVTVNLLP
ncbi:MAG: LysM peptidoglycan-binding domain-containing protein [Chloroflexota bacterium]